MKILWHSNTPWSQTGYGQQTALFTTRLRDAGHDVAISATWGLGGCGLVWEDMRVYPQDDRWGKALLTSYAKHHGEGGPCLILSLCDVFVLTSDALSSEWVASWTPVDHDPLPPRVYEYFARTGAKPISMSQFGHQALVDAGLDPIYVPHGVETSVFRPRYDIDLGDIRRGMNLPEDSFVVGMVAANKGTSPPRKAFPQVFQAFSELRKKHDDAFLYLHTEALGMDRGINIPALADACGVPAEAMSISDQVMLQLGVPADDMSVLYTGFDVLANPSYGEGFGIPIIESQACGTPVIVTNTTSMPELVGAGWVVEGDPYYDPGHGAFWKSPSVAELYDAMEEAYGGSNRAQLAHDARQYALAYDADKVFSEHWLPALDQLDQPREVGPLDGRTPKHKVALPPLPEGAIV